MNNKVNVLGVKIDKFTIKDTVDAIMGFIESNGETKTVYTPNSEIVMQGYRNKNICDALNSADILTADGIGVVYASRVLKNPISERCAGYDTACLLLEKMGNAGKSVYLFGSKPGVAEKAADEMRKKYSGLVIAGCDDGYFDEVKEKEIIRRINEKKPDVLFVCLGAPKQEMWIYEHKNELDCRVCMGLGGSLDVFAGEVERAPEFFQKHGIEWLYRLMKEPKRIIRMMDLPKFAITVMLKGKKYKQEQEIKNER